MSDNPLKIWEDRSGLLSYQACPRLRFWEREFNRGVNGHCGGLQPLKKSIYLVLGGAVHTGLNHMMDLIRIIESGELSKRAAWWAENKFGEPEWDKLVLVAADKALAEFDLQISSDSISVPDAKTPEQVDWKLREARALVEGLVMVAGFRLVPNLVERFRVVEVEREKRFKLGSIRTTVPMSDEEFAKANQDINRGVSTQNWATIGGDLRGFLGQQRDVEIWFESRADALLEERSTGDLYVHSWKTSGDYGRQEEEQFKRDVQGLSEAIAIEEDHYRAIDNALAVGHESHNPDGYRQLKIQGIQMAFLLKGRKSRQSSTTDAPQPAFNGEWGDSPGWHGLGDGLRYHQSPIVHGWRMFSHGITPEDDCSTWAWSYTFPKAENKSGKGRLGKGWEPVAIFDNYPGGTRQWILDLLGGKWQPEAGDPFRQVVAMPEPWSRSDREVEDWLEEVRAQVEEIHPRAEEIRQAMAKGDWWGARSLLNRYFPKDRSSCFRYGGRCWAEAICFGPDEVGQGPLGNGFRLREPHHSLGGEE